MTDRELLELAAKAAGWEWDHYGDPYDEKYGLISHLNPDEAISWNPLANNGDAFALMIRLEMDVMPRVVGGRHINIVIPGKKMFIYDATDDDDPYSMTCRAIVRAAAEIGRTMP